MAGRLSVACVSFLAVLAFLLLFASGTHVEATTYKMGYSSELSCDGPDKTPGMPPGTGDDSCTPVAPYFARAAGLHADVVSYFDVWLADPKHSMYSLLATMGTPSTWQISTDKEIPDGAYVGDMVALSTLGLFGMACTTPNVVTIPLYDCSTDTTDTIAWDAPTSGENLTYGHEGGLPAGCLKYPEHVKGIVGDVQPRARYYGFTIVIGGMPPTQLNFLMFNPGQLSGEPAGGTSSAPAPRDDFSDDLGYINFTVLDNPNIPAGPDSALDELCTPLGTTTNLLGVTGGEGALDRNIPPVPGKPFEGSFWVVGETCGNGIDDDGNTRIDEMCGIVRVTNPAADSGIYDTGSHMAGGYSQSYRDADGDTIPNNEDECPFDVDTYTEGVWDDADGDHINDACDTTTAPCDPLECDEDDDGWRNQADNCPLDFQDSQANDADDDSIGDECDLVDAGTPSIGQGPDVPDGEFLNDLQWGSICIEADDSDGDGWCDATEDIVGQGGEVLSVSSTTPEGGTETARDVSPKDKTGDCVDGLDNDGDTYADSADSGNCTPGGPGNYPTAGYGCDAGCSVPEYYGIDWAVNTTGDDPPGVAPQSCSNWSYYDVNQNHPWDPHQKGAGNPVDDDGDTVVNATDNCNDDIDDDGDTNVNDGCPIVGSLPEDPSCVNAADDDADTVVNDGCPAKDAPETACDDDVDDDGDTRVNDGCPKVASDDDLDDTAEHPALPTVNDGCPQVGDDPETACDDDVDDDGDTTANDGCPKVGDRAETGAECIDPENPACANDIDDDPGDDGDTPTVNDGCPAKDNPEQAAPGPDPNCICESPDEVNDDCDQVGATAETDAQCENAVDDDIADTGAGRDESAIAYACDNKTDDDFDGVVNDGCDQVGATAETDAQCANDIDDDIADTGAGRDESDIYGACDNKLDDDFDGVVNDGCPEVGGGPESVCTGNVDEDDDGKVNDGCPKVGDGYANDGCPKVGDGYANDGCPKVGSVSETAGAQCDNNVDDDVDGDCDGIPDVDDNCPDVANPTQLNTDGVADGGDACDVDDDEDSSRDTDEWAAGSDPKNVCDPANFDLQPNPPSDGIINILDVLMFSNALMGKPCNPPADYLICEATYRSDP